MENKQGPAWIKIPICEERKFTTRPTTRSEFEGIAEICDIVRGQRGNLSLVRDWTPQQYIWIGDLSDASVLHGLRVGNLQQLHTCACS